MDQSTHQQDDDDLISYLAGDDLPDEVRNTVLSRLRASEALRREASGLRHTIQILRGNPECVEAGFSAELTGAEPSRETSWANFQKRFEAEFGVTDRSVANGSAVANPTVLTDTPPTTPTPKESNADSKQNLVTLVLQHTRDQQRKLLEVLNLAGAAFVGATTSHQLGYAREQSSPAATSNILNREDGDLSLELIQLEDFLLSIDISPIQNTFYVQMTLYYAQTPDPEISVPRHLLHQVLAVDMDSLQVIENCDVEWYVEGELKGTQNTGPEGVAEFSSVPMGVNTFRFSKFKNTIFEFQVFGKSH